eukprot:COSAG02_NODE_94_length_37427_cov_79.161728_1_plen_473_part_00
MASRSPPTPPELPVALAAHAAHWSCDVAAGPGIADRVQGLSLAELGELVQEFQERGALPEELHAAVSNGDAERAASLVAAVAEIKCAVDWRDAKGRTAAFVAASQNDEHSLSLLMSHGADLSAPDLEGRTLLHAAAGQNAVDCLRTLVRLQADTEATDGSTGATALHTAAAAGMLESVHLLLSAGARCAVQDGVGRTPLHVAAKAGHAEVILELLNADMGLLSTRDAEGRSARSCAAAQPRSVEQKLVVTMLDMFSAWPTIAHQALLEELRGCFPRVARSAVTLLKQVRELVANPSALTLGQEETKKLVQPCPRHTPRSKRTPRKAAIEPLSGRNSQSGQRRTASIRSPSGKQCETTQRGISLTTPSPQPPRNSLCTIGVGQSSPPDAAPSSPELKDGVALSTGARPPGSTGSERKSVAAEGISAAESAPRQETQAARPEVTTKEGTGIQHTENSPQARQRQQARRVVAAGL